MVPPVLPGGACEFVSVQTACACTARAQCTSAQQIIRRQVGLAKVHPCTEFGVASSKFTFTGGQSQNSFFAPGACSWHPTGTTPQWILSWCSTRVTCAFGISGAPRVTCRAVRKFLVDLHAAARATCHCAPPQIVSFTIALHSRNVIGVPISMS